MTHCPGDNGRVRRARLLTAILLVFFFACLVGPIKRELGREAFRGQKIEKDRQDRDLFVGDFNNQFEPPKQSFFIVVPEKIVVGTLRAAQQHVGHGAVRARRSRAASKIGGLRSHQDPFISTRNEIIKKILSNQKTIRVIIS